MITSMQAAKSGQRRQDELQMNLLNTTIPASSVGHRGDEYLRLLLQIGRGLTIHAMCEVVSPYPLASGTKRHYDFFHL